MKAPRWLLILGLLLSPWQAWAADEFGPNPTWKPVAASQVREQVSSWLDEQSADDQTRRTVEAIWPTENDPLAPGELLDRLAHSFAAASDEVRELVELCSQPKRRVVLPDFAWLLDERTPPLVRNNMRLYYGRWLAQQELYDEALLFLESLDVGEVVDPASLLFYQSVAHHRLVNIEESRAVALRLLEREDELPRRFQQLARLMKEDLKEVKDDSLDHIARRMSDIRRRLDLGRAGKKVREVEDGVIASLDKLIKNLEDQQKQQQQSAAGAQGGQSSSPAQDSRILTQKGPGKVEKKNIGSESGWGDLPPKEREEALQQIGKEFPSHFRDAIEQYFRKIASEESPEPR